MCPFSRHGVRFIFLISYFFITHDSGSERLLSPELSDTHVLEPWIRARLGSISGTAKLAILAELVILQLRESLREIRQWQVMYTGET